MESNLAGSPAHPDTLALTGSYLYALSPDLPDLTGLRFLHPGWWLGTLKKDRFEPSHALALGLHARDAQRTADYPSDGPKVLAYLRGETLSNAGANGWTLVTVDGFPLGWEASAWMGGSRAITPGG